MRTLAHSLLLSAAAGMLAGCGAGAGGGGGHYVKPTIAVMKFENRAPFPLGWKLGDGMQEILVDRLVATGRFHVVERPELDSILRELRFQQSGATRRQKRAQPGRIKNVQYLVKGTVTDFGHVSNSSSFLSTRHWDFLGGGARAVMGMTLYVVDVESGEIVCSESLEENVRAKDVAVKAAYKDVAFGGSVFYRTPLGRATAKVIDKAVERVAGAIARRPWVPKLALVQPDGVVVINGGRDRGVREGRAYEVVEAGAPIVDPDTGDVISRQPGRRVGRVRVRQVHQRHSVAAIVSGQPGDFRVGQACRPAKPVAESPERVSQARP